MKIMTAYFVKYPRSIDDLKVLHWVNNETPFAIKKTIDLVEIDFENFVSDMIPARDYLEGLDTSCGTVDGVVNCICVRQSCGDECVLLVVNNSGFVVSAGITYEDCA